MSFKEIKDERLELQKYKAGYKAFQVLIPLSVFIGFTFLGVLDIDTAHPILYLTFLPFFVGMGIFSYYAREYEEMDEEQTALKITAERRTWKVISRHVFSTIIFGMIIHFLIARKSLWNSLMFAILMGIGMGIFDYYRMKKVLKKSKETGNV